jgi:hypothetical protein
VRQGPGGAQKSRYVVVKTAGLLTPILLCDNSEILQAALMCSFKGNLCMFLGEFVQVGKKEGDCE